MRFGSGRRRQANNGGVVAAVAVAMGIALWGIVGCMVSFGNTGGDCGNGVIEGSETCDDGNSFSGDGCGGSCRVEDGWTCAGEPSLCVTECGDGVARGSEVCDDEDLRNLSCADLGLEGGDLSCSGNCTFNVSGCDRQAVCGNGAMEYPEGCDGADLGDQTCVSLGFDIGELGCTSVCSLDTLGCAYQVACGDNLAEGDEDCDGPDLSGATCESLGLDSGNLQCTAECAYNVEDCNGSATCGNGAIEYPEPCDGADLGGATCLDNGYYGGTLACESDCMAFDLTDCVGACGDGFTNGPEVCDIGSLGGRTCVDEGFYGGTLACRPDCFGYDVSGCIGTCGDGAVNGSEQCDGADLGGQDCVGLGHFGGTLGCSSACVYDDSGCHLTPRIVINEVGQGWPDTIELLNLSAVSVNLDAWSAEAHGSTYNGQPNLQVLDIPSYTLGAGARVLLLDTTSGGGGPPIVNTTDDTIRFQENIRWAGGLMPGAAVLYNGLDVEQDFVRWGGSTINPPAGTGWADTPRQLTAMSGEGVTLSRVPDGVDTDVAGDFCATEATDNQPNGPCLTSPAGSVVLITEVDIGNPDGLELYNAGTMDVNLLGWTYYYYDDGSNEWGGTTLPSYVLAAGDYVELVDTGNDSPPYAQGDQIFVPAIAWTPPDAGGAGLVDPESSGRDFVRWSNSALTPWAPDLFTDTPSPAPYPNYTYTLGRFNLTDTDTAGDWCRQLPSLGSPNSACM